MLVVGLLGQAVWAWSLGGCCQHPLPAGSQAASHTPPCRLGTPTLSRLPADLVSSGLCVVTGDAGCHLYGQRSFRVYRLYGYALSSLRFLWNFHFQYCGWHTGVWFTVPTECLTAACNSTSGNQMFFSLLWGHQACKWYMYINPGSQIYKNQEKSSILSYMDSCGICQPSQGHLSIKALALAHHCIICFYTNAILIKIPLLAKHWWHMP